MAARFLERRGAQVIERNRRVGRGEIDLLVTFDRLLVAVEVKTVGPRNPGAPIDRFDDAKRFQVRRLANQVQASRVDFIGVRLTATGVEVRWLPGIA